MFSGYIYKCTTRHQTWEESAGENMGYLWVTRGLPTRRSVWICLVGWIMSIPSLWLWRQVHLAMLLGQKIISPQISPCVPCALAVAGLTWLKTGSKDGINMSSIMIHQHWSSQKLILGQINFQILFLPFTINHPLISMNHPLTIH